MKREDAKELFRKLAASYPNWKVNQGIAENWLEELEQSDAEHCWANAKEHIRESKFPPSVAEIVRKNERIMAEREIEKTREMIRKEDGERESAPRLTPWQREGISREEWMKKTIAAAKGKQ